MRSYVLDLLRGMVSQQLGTFIRGVMQDVLANNKAQVRGWGEGEQGGGAAS